ncbi:hypothetical protein ACROYT_G030079 [Oculina patagonica]
MVIKQLVHISVLFVLCQIYGTATQQCTEAEYSKFGMMLREHIFKKITGVSLSGLCLVDCYQDVRCQSFNYVISQYICELNNRTKEARPEDYVPDPDRLYFRRDMNRDIDECSASIPVCDVNAICKNTRGSYRCSCKAGFTGDGKSCTAPLVTATSSCANLLVHQTKTSGIIQTGDYLRYGENMDCRWNISSNVMLELVFLRMDTYNSNDYLLVYDGGSSSSTLIGTFSGSSLPAPITSSTNKLYAKFISDASNTREGILARYQAIASGSIRLNGSTPTTGRVEVYYDGQWGTVCDNAWDINDANVVCRQLGYQQASRAFRGATHGQGTGPIWMDDVACSGSESHIYDCRHRGWGNNDCTHNQDASVECSAVRLVNGGANYGRVEVSLNGIWGTVCDDGWNIKEANVVCRQLGFSSASSAPGQATNGQGSGYIWMDDVNCQGGEDSIFDCAYVPSWSNYNCRHSEDASVVCNT